MHKINLILYFSLIIQGLHGQNSKRPIVYDSVPFIKNFSQDLPLLDKVRCAVYLFAHDFTVKDSLGNFYVSLYFEKENHETTTESVWYTSLYIYNVIYRYVIEPIAEEIKGSYHHIVVAAYNKYGKLISNENFPIVYAVPPISKAFMKTILEVIRVPNTWRIVHNRYEFVFYCMDSTEQMKYSKPLILIFSKLKLLNKKCKVWKEFYPNCYDRDVAQSATINLPQ